MTSQLQTELRATCTAWTAWAVALRWLNLAATVCDGKPSELGRDTATYQQYKHGILVCLYSGFGFVFVFAFALLPPVVLHRLRCFSIVRQMTIKAESSNADQRKLSIAAFIRVNASCIPYRLSSMG